MNRTSDKGQACRSPTFRRSGVMQDSIYWSDYIPTLNYGHEIWVMTKRTRSWIQESEMNFLHRTSIGWGVWSRVAASPHRKDSDEVAFFPDDPWWISGMFLQEEVQEGPSLLAGLELDVVTEKGDVWASLQKPLNQRPKSWLTNDNKYK